MITIFSTTPLPRSERASSAVAVSLLLHSVVLLVVASAVSYSHTDFSTHPERKYQVHFIHLQLSAPVPTRTSRRAAELPAVWRARQAPPVLHRVRAKQTLIRPDVAPDVVLKQVMPVAALMPWSENPLPSPPEFVPLPKERPALPAPSRPPQLSPEVPPANVISLPNVLLRLQDLVVVPPANQIASDDGEAANPSRERERSRTGSEVTSASDIAVSQSAALAITTEAPLQGSGSGETASLVRIEQAKDGKFGIVVSGSSASDQFPESAGALSGKVVYTVYLRIGLRKNWILQYCLPQSVELGGAAVDAPWPLVMLRPDPLNKADLDYIIVGGVINSSGRFEQLGLVYPAELNEQDKLLGALRQWTFRPASRDGQAVAVEALLVIPRQAE